MEAGIGVSFRRIRASSGGVVSPLSARTVTVEFVGLEVSEVAGITAANVAVERDTAGGVAWLLAVIAPATIPEASTIQRTRD